MNVKTMRRGVLAGALALAAACAPTVAPHAIELAEGAMCSMDGMLIADFPGPKGQIVYDRGEPDVFCDTVELLSALLQPEQEKRVVGVYTQDMAQTSWEKPQGHWIDARTAFYVIGSRKLGSMGPTLGAFAKQADAQAFARDNGGKVVAFADIKPAMVALDGGVLKDAQMR